MPNVRAASSAPTHAAVKSRMAGMAGMSRPGIVLTDESTLTESCTEF
jgi:hypothetical protein